MSIDRILDLEKQFAGQAAYLDALASAIAALETRQRRVDLEARLSDAPTARFGLFSGEGVGAAGSTEPGLTGLLADDAVTGDTIADGAINDIAKFASTIKPPLVVTSLPALPDALYPAGSGQMLFLTTTKRLYKTNDGTTWVAVTDAADLTGTITTTQIADDAITTPKLLANAVTAAKIAAGTITANEIAADTITAGQIAAAAIGASEIAAGAITTAKLAVGDFTRYDPANLLVNASFEEYAPGVTPGVYYNGAAFPGWTRTGGGVTMTPITSANAKHGQYILGFKEGGGGSNQGLFQTVPVKEGRRYRLSGWAWKGAGAGANAQILAHSRDKTGAFVAFNVLIAVNHNATAPVQGEAYFTIPAGVAYLTVYCRSSGVPGATEVFAFEDVRLEELPEAVQNSTGEVVISNAGVAITNGKLTLTNAGSTVVIDGTSNMFKIAATGTLSVVTADGTAGLATATVLGAAPGGSLPQHLASTYVDAGSMRMVGTYLHNIGLGFLSSTSGGAVTTKVAFTQLTGVVGIILSGTIDVQVRLETRNHSGASRTGYGRYYLLKEAGI